MKSPCGANAIRSHVSAPSSPNTAGSTRAELDTVEAEVEHEVATAFASAEAAPWPDLALLTADVYTTY